MINDSANVSVQKNLTRHSGQHIHDFAEKLQLTPDMQNRWFALEGEVRAIELQCETSPLDVTKSYTLNL